MVVVTDHEPRGGAFYDDPRVLDEYLSHRHAAITSPNLVMEEPAFLAEAGDLTGLRILDLGCGDGSFGLMAYERGCVAYTGIDGSSMMVDRARKALATTTASVLHHDIEDVEILLDSENERFGQRFDLVTSRMALHYIDDLSPVLRGVHGALGPGGRFVMSVVHPVISSFDNNDSGPRTTWTVDNYFDQGPRQRRWFGSTVTWYHRSVETYVTALAEAGLRLTGLREGAPVPELFADAADELARRRRVPLFLILQATV